MIPKDKQKVPPLVYNALKRYLTEGTKPGDFTLACLRNDLRMAVALADTDSFANLHGIVIFLVNYAPSACWGSNRAVNEWMRMVRDDKLPPWQKRAIEIELEEYQQYVLDNND